MIVTSNLQERAFFLTNVSKNPLAKRESLCEGCHRVPSSVRIAGSDKADQFRLNLLYLSLSTKLEVAS